MTPAEPGPTSGKRRAGATAAPLPASGPKGSGGACGRGGASSGSALAAAGSGGETSGPLWRRHEMADATHPAASQAAALVRKPLRIFFQNNSIAGEWDYILGHEHGPPGSP